MNKKIYIKVKNIDAGIAMVLQYHIMVPYSRKGWREENLANCLIGTVTSKTTCHVYLRKRIGPCIYSKQK